MYSSVLHMCVCVYVSCECNPKRPIHQAGPEHYTEKKGAAKRGREVKEDLPRVKEQGEAQR